MPCEFDWHYPFYYGLSVKQSEHRSAGTNAPALGNQKTAGREVGKDAFAESKHTVLSLTDRQKIQ